MGMVPLGREVWAVLRRAACCPSTSTSPHSERLAQLTLGHVQQPRPPHTTHHHHTRTHAVHSHTQVVPGAFAPWGSGPRACVGLKFAEAEAVITLVRLYQQASAAPTTHPCTARAGGAPSACRPAGRLLPPAHPLPPTQKLCSPPTCRPPLPPLQYTFRLTPGQVPLKTKTLITHGPVGGVRVTVHRR